MKRQPNIIRFHPRACMPCAHARTGMLSACKTAGYVFASVPEDQRIKTAAHENP